MNKYEEFFINILDLYIDKGLWVKTEYLKIGFNYLSVEKVGDKYFDFEDESDCITSYDKTISDYFEYFKDIKFCFTLEKALEGNFITWNEFCNRVDNGHGFGDIASI